MSQSLPIFWMALQFFSPSVKNKDGGIVISMPQDKVTKSAIQALVDNTSGLSGAKVNEKNDKITVYISGINKSQLG